MPSLCAHAIEEMRLDGFRHHLMLIRDDNVASLRCNRRVGFKPTPNAIREYRLLKRWCLRLWTSPPEFVATRAYTEAVKA